MSNPIEGFLKSVRGQQGQQGQSQSTPSQAMPVVDSLPTPPIQQQSQPLPPMIPASQSIVEGMVMELSKLTSIERAIVALALGFDEPLKNISPDEWAKLLEERVGKIYGEAFRKWVRAKNVSGGNE